MRMKSFLVVMFVLSGIIVSGCDKGDETSKKVTNNSSISQTQNIQEPKPAPTTDDEKTKAWKKATDTSGHDFSKYSKPVP